MWVSEIVYVPLETPLLKAARRIGCATADGGHMNVGQALGAFKLFTGLEPSRRGWRRTSGASPREKSGSEPYFLSVRAADGNRALTPNCLSRS